MTITLTTTLVTSAEILNYHGKGMNALQSESGTRVYSDDVLESVMNTIIEFVTVNAPSSTSQTLLKFAYKELCKIELNNRLFEDNYIANWQYVDTFDKDYLKKLLMNSGSDDEPGTRLWIENNLTEY